MVVSPPLVEDQHVCVSQYLQGKYGNVLIWIVILQNLCTCSVDPFVFILALHKQGISFRTYPQQVAWLFCKIWSTRPGGGPRCTGTWCIMQGRETWVPWPAGERPPWEWRCTAGGFDTLSPWRWFFCTWGKKKWGYSILLLQFKTETYQFWHISK